MRGLRSYIIRIYRRGACGVTGIVEDVKSGDDRSFSTKEHLWDLLTRTAFRRGRSGSVCDERRTKHASQIEDDQSNDKEE